MADHNQWRIVCPHCGHTSTVRTSRQLSPTMRESTVTCDNPECMHSWIATLEAVRTIAPSIAPRQGVFIPLSPRSLAAQPPADAQLELCMDHPAPRSG